MFYKIRLIFLTLLMFVSTLGFRTFSSSVKWDIDNTSTARTKLFVIYTNGTTTLENDLPSGDALYGTATITVDQAMASIFNDYSSIDASFLTLVDNTDADYATQYANRVINIDLSGSSGLTSGEAQGTVENNKIVGCEINLSQSILDSAKSFISTVTHELGHCVGLDHPQETVNARMSYFSPDTNARLLLDDKMGVVYLYPTQKSYGEESSTFGMSCTRKK